MAAESLPPAYRPSIGGVRKRLEDRPPRLARIGETGQKALVDTGLIAVTDKRGSSYAERTREGTVRDGDGVEVEDDWGPETSPPPTDYPADGEAWVEARTKRARKRLRKKEQKKAALDASAAMRGAKTSKRDSVPPPTVGGTNAGVRRTGASKGAAGVSARSGTRRGPASAGVATRPRVGGPGGAGGRPLLVRENKFRAPRTAAVLIKCAEDKDRSGGVTYAEVMKLARSKISLDDLSIVNTRIRKAQAGGLLIEIPGGEEAGAKAEALVDRIKGVLAETEYKEVQVVRPVRRAELRLIDIDQSVTTEEVAEAIARNGQVRLADVRVGPLRPGRGGLNAVWVQCPLACANKLLGDGRVRVGWTMAGMVPLAKRRLQCFRCFAVGHTRANCLSQVDRTDWCFQCGGSDGHRAAGCRKPPKCPVSRPSQDLIARVSEELSLGIVAIAEPSGIPDSGCWVSSSDDPPSAAITWQWSRAAVPCTLKWRGAKFVAVDWGDLVVVSCYFSPRLSETEFFRGLHELESRLLGVRGHPVVIMGDFNARAHAWDPGRPNRRGAILASWMGLMDLQIINEGSEPTCVHPRGVSCVDITLATPTAARRISAWRVEAGLESLSDHKYIVMEVGTSLVGPTTGKTALRAFPRWAVGKADLDLMEAAAVFTAWTHTPGNGTSEAEKIDRALQDISDTAMPSRGAAKKPTTYWWNEEISDLRRKCNASRRRLTRARARNRLPPVDIQTYWDELREDRRRLRVAIRRSKARLWGELLNDLDRDPWGMPYRLVLRKLHVGGASVVEVLPPEIVEEIVTTLFPADNTPQDPGIPVEWHEDMEVTPVEVLEAGTRVKLGKAPGPDGITGHVVKKTLESLAPLWAMCFTECLRRGHFPRKWKMARLVLVKKLGKPDLSPSSYRALCLLSEAGKLLERVIVRRLQTFLDDTEGVANGQYGFRRQRSTIDAIWCLRERVEQGTRDGGVVVAVSLDIANAFNSLPWPVIKRALGEKDVPGYIRNILHDYLADRGLSYVNRRDRLVRKDMTCGVPQGSVLGPTLWNIGYDTVLRANMPICCSVLCYADDTLLVACAASFDEARIRAEMGATFVIRMIERLGLKVSISKTEAVAFMAEDIPRGAAIRIDPGLAVGLSGPLPPAHA
ncbi:PREDICTED: uncharacterized protein LOC108764875 [Trachymyrmex cornetzi]|uniref:uncharacterized protein LOC108764875 n=1 Tax=Trachymyrmex cornetzi TaxID=471704 RepID=UPI00084EF804|nr:PREDICTED: uncharacterized protein LOC108764875 [Trachymyrmex cornetzi]